MLESNVHVNADQLLNGDFPFSLQLMVAFAEVDIVKVGSITQNAMDNRPCHLLLSH